MSDLPPAPPYRLVLDPAALARLTGGRWDPAPPPAATLSQVYTRTPRGMPQDALYVVEPDPDEADKAVEARAIKAVAQGAGALVVAPGVATGVAIPRLVVDRPRRALRHIAAAVRDAMTARRVLVTGTEGKTGFKDLLAHLIHPQCRVHVRPSSNNKDLPIAAALASLQPWHDVAVIEVAAPSHRHAMRRSGLVRPDVCVITEVGFEHLKRHGSADRLIEHKATVTEACQPDGTVILPASNDRHAALRAAVERRWTGRILTFGTQADADARLLSSRFDPDRLGWHLHALIAGTEVRFFCPRPEEHAPQSCLGPLLAAHALGLDVARAAARIADYQPYKTEGTLSVLHLGKRQVLLYDKAERAYLLGQTDFLRTVARLRPRPGGRKIVVLGEVYDEREYGPAVWDLLPPDQMRTLLAEAGIDALFTRGPVANVARFIPPDLVHAAHEEGAPIGLLPALLDTLKDGDILAIKGDVNEAMPALTAALRDAAHHVAPLSPDGPGRPLPGDPVMAEPASAHRDALDAAWTALAAPDISVAVKALGALPEEAASSAEGLRLAGRVAWRRGLPEAAMTLLAQAVTKAPSDAAALVDLAVLQMEAGQSDLAETLLNTALQHMPSLPEAHAALATLAEAEGDTEAALRHLRAACAKALAERAGLA